MRVLVTGGAGFVGSSLATRWKAEHPTHTVLAFDNLRRRGSELTLRRLREGGVGFVHGDVRVPDDLAEVGGVDLVLECSAEPSVHAGYAGGASYLVQTNLVGTANVLEVCRAHGAALVFLSTSRLYPIGALRELPFVEAGTRLAIAPGAQGVGWSDKGVSEDFPLTGARSLYGATKLASELLIEEYRAMFGLRAVVNRCGVLSGPWQMGKVDQGFLVLWAARHLYGGALAYMGFGGRGLQVRDALHVDDLYRLVVAQVEGAPRELVYNVGGGASGSVSLQEATALCEARAGRSLAIATDPTTRAADIPWYVTDASRAQAEFGWAPRHTPASILDDIFDWLRAEDAWVRPVLEG